MNEETPQNNKEKKEATVIVEEGPRTEEEFYREVEEMEKIYQALPDLTEEDINKFLPGNFVMWLKYNVKRMDPQERRKHLETTILNNFFTRMPGRNEPSAVRGAWVMKSLEERLKMDEFQTQYGRPSYSKMLEDIDRLIPELGYDIEEVKKWTWDEYTNGDHNEFLIKLFLAMRQIGYAQRPDLIG